MKEFSQDELYHVIQNNDFEKLNELLLNLMNNQHFYIKINSIKYFETEMNDIFFGILSKIDNKMRFDSKYLFDPHNLPDFNQRLKQYYDSLNKSENKNDLIELYLGEFSQNKDDAIKHYEKSNHILAKWRLYLINNFEFNDFSLLHYLTKNDLDNLMIKLPEKNDFFYLMECFFSDFFKSKFDILIEKIFTYYVLKNKFRQAKYFIFMAFNELNIDKDILYLYLLYIYMTNNKKYYNCKLIKRLKKYSEKNLEFKNEYLRLTENKKLYRSIYDDDFPKYVKCEK